MNIYCGVRSTRGLPIAPLNAMGRGLFSFDLLDVLSTRCIRQKQRAPRFGLSHLATTFMNNPRSPNRLEESLSQCTKVPFTRFDTRKYGTKIEHASTAAARSSIGSASF